MTDSNDQLSLAAEFPPSSPVEWRKLVDAALKGASFDKRLVSHTYDGLRVEPLYPRATSARPVDGRAALPWQVLARADHPDPKAANTEILHELENGATGLALVIAGSAGARGFGLDGSAAAIETALEGVYLDAGISVELDIGADWQAVDYIAALVKKRGAAPDKTQIRFGLDPLGALACSGGAPMAWDTLASEFGKRISELASRGYRGPFAAADGRPVHAAGGTEAQELAFAIANALAYLRALEAAGIALDVARRVIFFRLAADADEFLTIAKYRALRKLWAQVEQACGLEPQPAIVSAETAWRMMTRRDPYVNMLRTTIAVAAAGLGGADAISALPFTAANGLPDRFARRVARNMQLILLEEANLYRVVDPAAGSGGIEYLTDELCKAGWTIFQEIEAAGGAATALEQGLLQKKVAETRSARQAAVAKRKDAFTGTSDYPNLGEVPVKVLDVPRVTAPEAPTTFEALPSIRLAEPFEALRDKSDAILAKTGSRPKVFLANLGKLSEFTTRATFARNLYEAGGIEAVMNDGFPDLATMVAAFKASGAKLACLCSSDTVYARVAVDAARELGAAGAIVHFAGRPGELEAELREAGVNTFVFAGCDALATLRATHGILGVK